MTDMKDIPMNPNQVFPLGTTTELMAAMCSDAITPEGLAEFKTDPHAFLLANTDVNVDEGVKLQLVDNDNKTLHLALPYYSALDNIPQEMADNDMNVAGGIELFVIAVVTSGGALVGFTAVGAGVGAGVGIGVGTGIAIGAAVAAGVASTAALAGLGVAAAHAGMSLEDYSSGVTTTSTGNGGVWKRSDGGGGK